MRLVKPSYDILEMSTLPFQSIEEAARTCYKSEDKITPDSAKKFVENLVKRGHHAMIEFADMTVRFVCDRGVTHELVRHRLCSFAQESTRYCNYSKDKHKNQLTFIIPSWMYDITEGLYETGSNFKWHKDTKELDMSDWTIEECTWMNAMYESELSYLKMIQIGSTPQQARSVLPNSLKSEIVVKANFREWMHIFALRNAPTAHPQMQELMAPLHLHMKDLCPEIFESKTK